VIVILFNLICVININFLLLMLLIDFFYLILLLQINRFLQHFLIIYLMNNFDFLKHLHVVLKHLINCLNNNDLILIYLS